MGRGRSCRKEINKGTWSKEEDEVLFNYVSLHGEGKWKLVSQFSGLKRCAKSCRYRYLNYLKPTLKRGDISKHEQDLIIRLHRQLGNRWALIARNLPGRTDIEIKNHWKIYLSKKSHHHHHSKLKKNKITNFDDEDNNDGGGDVADDNAIDDFLLINNIDDNAHDDDNMNPKMQQTEEEEEEKKKEEKMGRNGMKGAWSKKEDEILLNYVAIHGEGKWNNVAERTGLNRCGKSCRHRYLHYLKSGIKRGNISEDEENMIIRLHGIHGNRWTLIAKNLPGRTDSEIKNHWHAYLSKKMQEQSKSSTSLNHYQEQQNNEVPLPTSTHTKDFEEDDDIMMRLCESTDQDHTNNAFSPINSFQIEYDGAFLDDFLFNIFQNDQMIRDDMNFKIPHCEDYNMAASSSSSSYIDQQCQVSQDVLDFWTSSEFPFFE